MPVAATASGAPPPAEVAGRGTVQRLVPPAENVRPIEPEEDAPHRHEETLEVVLAK